jgi:hypothetical protein
MRKIDMKETLSPNAWGLEINSKGELTIAGCSTVELAAELARRFISSMMNDFKRPPGSS